VKINQEKRLTLSLALCHLNAMMVQKKKAAPIYLKLRALRQSLAHKDRRFYQTVMARALGMDPSTIAKYESGDRHMPCAYVESFADYVGVEQRELLKMADECVSRVGA
jgi:hypothetical protein